MSPDRTWRRRRTARPRVTIRETWPWWIAGVGVALAYAIGLRLDVMEIDAAEYAAIAREMLEKGAWLELTNRGEPFLDKPPLLFWASRLSFGAFGVSNVAYKLPSFLVFLFGLYSTVRLGSHYAGRRAGLLSGVVLGTCQGAFL
jgi:4-amino-4-deoxy-L-arabinose transferase-like glycosyltransferase